MRDLAYAWIRALRCALPAIARDAATAFLVGFAVWLATLIVAPVMECNTKAVQALAHDREARQAALCESWGAARGSAGFIRCLADLERARQELDCCIDKLALK